MQDVIQTPRPQHALNTKAVVLGATAFGILLILTEAGAPDTFSLVRLALGGLAIIAIAALVIRIRRLENQTRSLEASLREEEHRINEITARRAETMRMFVQELDNPHSAIAMAAEALRRVPTSNVETIATGIAEEVEAARKMVRSLIEIARSRLPQTTLEQIPVSLAKIARSVVAGFDPGRHTLTLMTEGPDPIVSADPDAIGKAIRHILANAVAYTSPGPIVVTVRTSGSGQLAIIEIADQGPAIPAAERGDLFRRFVRLSTASGTPGAGLGLYLVRLIADANGGTATVDWPANGGNRFRISLPLIPSTYKLPN